MTTNGKTFLITTALFVFLGGAYDARGQSTFQAANPWQAGMPAALVEGAATLTRNDDGISFRIYTTGLKQGATTTWIVVFNNPENCANGTGACMGADLFNPTVNGSIVYGGAYNVGPQGIGNFHGELKEGDPPAGIQVNVPAGMANGLADSKAAEIHFVVRGHGKPLAGQAVTQFTTFEPGASPGDQQVVVFPALAP